MKSEGFYLDVLLRLLNKDRDRPINDRLPVKADNFLADIVSSDRHEDFIELVDTLLEERYVRLVPKDWHKNPIDKYQDVIITLRGSHFIELGGYHQKKIFEAADDNRIKAQAKATLLLTAVLALGTFPIGLLALVDLYWRYNWFHSCFWWAVSGWSFVAIGISVLILYKVKKKKAKPKEL